MFCLWLLLVSSVLQVYADEARYTRLGMQYDGEGRFEESRKAFETAAKHWPSTRSLVNLGVFFMRRASGSREYSLKHSFYHNSYQAMAEGGRLAVSDSDRRLYTENWNALMTNFKLESIPLPSQENVPEACGPALFPEDVEEDSIETTNMFRRPFLLHQRPVPEASPIVKIPANTTSFPMDRPFILTGAMDDWLIPKKNAWDLLKRLAEAWPKAVTDFYPYNMLSKARRSPYLTRLATAVNELGLDSKASKFKDVPSDKGRYMHLQLTPQQWLDLQDWHILHLKKRLSDDTWLYDCLDNNQALIDEFHIKTHWKILLAGSSGAGMFNHSDSLQTSSWHAHLSGRKWWYICRDATCFEHVLQPGDILFYGQAWYHETQNLDTPTITLTDTSVHALNFQAVADTLFNECAYATLNFHFSALLCDALDSAYTTMARIYRKNETLIPTALLGTNSEPRSWRRLASSELVAKREATLPSHNNYDGRNYITE